MIPKMLQRLVMVLLKGEYTFSLTTQAEDELAKQLSQMKVMVQGTQGQPHGNRRSKQRVDH